VREGAKKRLNLMCPRKFKPVGVGFRANFFCGDAKILFLLGRTRGREVPNQSVAVKNKKNRSPGAFRTMGGLKILEGGSQGSVTVVREEST